MRQSSNVGLLVVVLGLGLSLLGAGCADGEAGGRRRDGGEDGGPRDGGLDASWVARDGGWDAGPIERVGLCETCTLHAQCGPTGRCIELTDGSFACVAICNPDIPSCPRSFDCVLNFSAPEVTVCVPIGMACCIDEDADGFGRGAACMGPDCNDGEASVNPGTSELCNGVDDDCDDAFDEAASDCGMQRCVGTMAGTYEAVPPDTCTRGSCSEMGRTSCGLYTCVDGEDDGDFCATTCAIGGIDSDAHCVIPAHCDLGTCTPDVPNGNACDEDSDCRSNHCDNGFCCDDGVCCGAVADCPSIGGIGTTCDDTVTCQGSRGEITCEMNRCGTRSGVPDDSACGPAIEADSCGPYRSVHCTGAASQPVPRCPSACTRDADCDDDAHCDGVCVPDVPNGNLCDEDSDCVSDHCNNDVCCNSGDCCRAPADCPGSYSRPAVCHTPLGCQGSRDAAVCSDYRCGTMVGVGDDSACTMSTLANDCGLYLSRFCSGGTDQTPPMCATSCTADAECDDNAHCDLNACVPDLPNGSACDELSDCVSGHCQNGFCCASGDCCAVGTDCAPATYGAASVCDVSATCQGHRVDPICLASNQCATGPPVDDDSGCAGLVSNACGLYPSVSCTAMMSQPTDQMSRCATSCTTSSDCDAGAYCMGGMCQPRGMQGDACTATSQCASGLTCADGVCCNNACPGTCRSCAVPGLLGTCSNIPAGADPDGECGGVSCSAYYAAWVGDRCFRRADAPATAVDCNGGGACETAAMVCPAQGNGSVQIDCDNVCQSPNLATCTGTSAGTCTNAPAGSQSCGTGRCARTSAICNMGTQVMCTPGSPIAESCNDMDDDCDTRFDEGLSGDAFEPNNVCNGTGLGTIYSQAAAGQPSSVTRTPTIYGAGDVDVWQVRYEENDSSCGCGGISTDEDYAIVATLTVPAGAGSYRVCGRWDSCSVGDTSSCVTVPAGSTNSITFWDDGCCSPIGCNDSRTGFFVVSGVGAPAFECSNYTVTFSTLRGCR